MGLYEEMLGLASKDTVAIEDGMLPGADAPQPGLTVERARQFAEESGPVGTAVRSAMSSASAGLSQPMLDALAEYFGGTGDTGFSAAEKLQILEQQYPDAALGGSIAGAVTPFGATSLVGRGATALATKLGPKAVSGMSKEAAKQLARKSAIQQGAARVAGDIGLGGLQAGLEDKSVAGGMAAGALGGAIGEGLVPLATPLARKYGEKVAAQIEAKTGIGKTTQKILTSIDNLQKAKGKLEITVASRRGEGEKAIEAARQKDITQARTAKKELAKAEKELARLQTRISKGDFKQGTPEYNALQEADAAVSSAQKYVDQLSNEIDKLTGRAEIAAGKARRADVKSAQKALTQKESALEGLTRRAEVEAGKQEQAVKKGLEKEIAKTQAKIESQEGQERMIGVLRRLMEESDEQMDAFRKQLDAAKKSEEAAKQFEAKGRAEAPAEKPALTGEQFRYQRGESQEEREFLEDAYAMGESLRKTADAIGMDFRTLNRKLNKKYGITRESAKEASEKRAAERAAQAEKAAAPEVAPEVLPRPKAPGLFEAYPSTKGDIRQVMKGEAAAPGERQILEQRLAGQQQALSEVGPVGVEQTAYRQALESQQQAVAQAQQAYEQASQAGREAAATRLAAEQEKLAKLQEPGIFDVGASEFAQTIGRKQQTLEEAQQTLQQAQQAQRQAKEAFDAAPSPLADEQLRLANQAVEDAQENVADIASRAGEGQEFARQQMRSALEPIESMVELTDKQLNQAISQLEAQGKITQSEMSTIQRLLAGGDAEARAMVRNIVYEKMQEDQLTNQ
jgi:hypothetical protein